MAGTTAKGGKKGRKYGRNKAKPSQMRYTNERRWEKNKMRKAQKYANKFGVTVDIKLDGKMVSVSPRV